MRTIEPLAPRPNEGVERLIWKLEMARDTDHIFHVTREELDAVRVLKTEVETLRELLKGDSDE